MSGRGTSQRPFTGWHLLGVMLGGFAVVVAVNVYMAMLATHTWTGMVVENSYAASQAFNATERLHREQLALGWRTHLAYTEGRLVLEARDGTGRPLDFSGVEVAVSRPIGATEDRTVALARQADGTYAALVPLSSGVWNAVATAARTPHGAFEQHSRLVIERGSDAGGNP